jgi:pimeloyl-ACP methyl ester carboxylesterase
MDIQGSPIPEAVGKTGLSILAPGAKGVVESADDGSGDTRSGRGDGNTSANEALAKQGIFVVERLNINLDLPEPDPSAATRGEIVAPPSVLVPVRDDETAYAVNYVDEATGASIWVFPKERAAAGSDLAFDLPPPPVPDAPDPNAPPTTDKDGTRGDITKAMRGLVTVVMWITDKVVGAGVNAIAEAWENSKRPYGLHQVAANGKMVEPDWNVFNGKPVLLLVHGTFSTPEAGFAGWIDHADFAAIHKNYGGRCLALAHPSMHASPADNVDWLLKSLPGDKKWTFNVVSHSRGGLVVRELAARASKDGPCQVDRMVMVAPPNFGTPLANARHWVTFLNTYTNILTDLPDTVTTVVTEGLLCLVKIIGSAATHGLSGIASMNVDDKYLRELAPRAYLNPDGLYAIASNYSPEKKEIIKQLAAKAADVVIDGFFKEENDMVVPTLGCSQGSLESVGFPIGQERLKVLGGPIHHCNYFQQPEVRQQLTKWLMI